MALPWLIGGAIVGGIALVSKLSSGSGGDDYHDDDEEEVRRRAARERKNRELRERLDTLIHLVREEGEQRGPIFQQQLESNFKVEYEDQPYAGNLDNDGYLNKSYDSLYCHLDSEEREILSDEQSARLETFLSFYNVEEMEATSSYSDMVVEDTESLKIIESLKYERLPQLMDLYEELGGSSKDLEYLEADFEKLEAFEQGDYSALEEVGRKDRDFSGLAKNFHNILSSHINSHLGSHLDNHLGIHSDNQNDNFQGNYIREGSSKANLVDRFKDIQDIQDIQDINDVNDVNKDLNVAINELLNSLSKLKK